MKATSSRVKIIRKPNKEKWYREDSCQLYTSILLADKSFDPIFSFLIGHRSNSEVSPSQSEGSSITEGVSMGRKFGGKAWVLWNMLCLCREDSNKAKIGVQKYHSLALSEPKESLHLPR